MNSFRYHVTKRVPGLLFGLLAVSAFFAQFALEPFVVEATASDWFAGLQGAGLQYRLGLLSYVLMNVVWLGLAYALYRRFEAQHRTMAQLVLLLVLAGSVTVFIAAAMQSAPLFTLAENPGLSGVTAASTMDLAQGLFLLGMKANKMAYLFYALWLIPLAMLFFGMDRISRGRRLLLGSALVIAAFGYLVDFVIFYLSPQQLLPVLSGYTFLGEVVVLLWLLIRGLGPAQGDHRIE